MIVLADANVERAANHAAYYSMFNCGQTCISIERCYVEAPIYDDFVKRVTQKVQAIRQGVPNGPGSFDVGSLTFPPQVETVERHVEEARRHGATVLTGGHRGRTNGYWFEPTVLVDVNHDMACMREETFGPTLPIMKVADADEAVRLANDSRYGLSATVWTADRERGGKIARRIEAGAVNVNDAFANLFSFGVPHSGWKQSGLGARLGGAYGIHKYCRAQSITESRLALRSELLWFPYTARKGRFTGALLRLLAARDLRRRLGRR
jgi:acyl-CoA reductase-like NAD-dependent aldehyde dehydrogenase